MSCFFENKSKEDIRLFLDSIIEEHVVKRDFTSSEIIKITDALTSIIQLAIAKHAAGCPLRQRFYTFEDQAIKRWAKENGAAEALEQADKKEERFWAIKISWVKIVYFIILTLVAIIGLILNIRG